MKITNFNPINIFYKYNDLNTEKPAVAPKKTEFLTFPPEYLGRSQVTFLGRNIELNSDDEIFIDAVSRDLRFSHKQKEQFSEIIKNYLNENNLKSLEEISGDDVEEQAHFLNQVSEKMDLSDSEFDVLTFHIIDRIFFDKVYTPQDRRFIKDLPIIEPILEKYKLDESTIDTLTDLMLIDADDLQCNTLFDIFNQHSKNLKDTMFFNALSQTMSSDSVTDIIIDLYLKSQQYEKEGEKIFPKHDKNTRFYNLLDDEYITDEILKEFNIAEEEGENIFNHIIKRHDDISYQQIAFEIADKYKLPPKADKKIMKIIKAQDECSYSDIYIK